jgi:hypothetical protein
MNRGRTVADRSVRADRSNTVVSLTARRRQSRASRQRGRLFCSRRAVLPSNLTSHAAATMQPLRMTYGIVGLATAAGTASAIRNRGEGPLTDVGCYTDSMTITAWSPEPPDDKEEARALLTRLPPSSARLRKPWQTRHTRSSTQGVLRGQSLRGRRGSARGTASAEARTELHDQSLCDGNRMRMRRRAALIVGFDHSASTLFCGPTSVRIG